MNTHHMIETNPEVMLPDEMVLELAVADNRLLITEDKDFGEWVFAPQHASCHMVNAIIRHPAILNA